MYKCEAKHNTCCCLNKLNQTGLPPATTRKWPPDNCHMTKTSQLKYHLTAGNVCNSVVCIVLVSSSKPPTH